jgi:hypothetical protein
MIKLFQILRKGGKVMNSVNATKEAKRSETVRQEAAGFETIFSDSRSSSKGQEQFVDSWDDCYDCDYNCEQSS